MGLLPRRQIGPWPRRFKRQSLAGRRCSTGGAQPPFGPPPHQILEQGHDQTPLNTWRLQAVREGVLVSLMATLLTSAVLAAPEAFRQSPATTFRQLSTPSLATQQTGSPGGLLLDCP